MNALEPLNAPISTAERIDSIDVLRGFALLGILMMNIQVFAMIAASYTNPTAYGDFEGLNYWIWWGGQVFFEQKMMSIFSLLFGAGIALVCDRAIQKTGRSAGLHYSRMFWLLVFGMVHAYLIWFGDILVCYALCGGVVYLLRRLSSGWLMVVGCVLIIIPSVIIASLGALLSQFDGPEFREAFEAPSAAVIAAENEAYRGSWLDQMPYRASMAAVFQTMFFAVWSFWRAAGLMLWGIVFFRGGVLSAKKTNAFYVSLAVCGFLIGFPLIVMGIRQDELHDWDGLYVQFVGAQYAYWSSLAIALGYVASVMLLVKNSVLPALIQKAFASVGQMALTNYLMQSIICTSVFYGHGLGWFGHVERTGQLAIVLSVWLLQMIVSPLWLSRFRFGPLEWLWRSLTYFKWQPMIRKT